MSQLKKGAFLNYASIFLTNIGGLLLTPFIIKQLGNSEFGLYSLIGAFVGYIGILDFGLGHTIIRFVAKYRAEGNRKEEENFLYIVTGIYITISIIITIIGIICYFNLDKIFASSLTPGEMERASIMFAILIFNLAITLPGKTFTGVCSGYEEFVFPKTVGIIRYIVRALMIVGILLLGGKAIALVILDTVLNVVIIVIHAVFVFKKLKVRYVLHKFEKKYVKEIFGYSFWIFVFVLVYQFQWRAGQMVLGIVTDTTVVAVFAVGVMLGGYYGAFSTAISSVFLPRATQMTVKSASSEELTDMMIKIGRISFIILMYILGAFLLFGKQFVLLWVGEDYIDAYFIALMIMVAYTIPLVQGFGNAILEARNKLSFKATIHLVFLALGTILGGWLAIDYGAIGMITGSVIGWIIVQNVMSVYYQRVEKLNMVRFFKELFGRVLFIQIAIVGICYTFNYLPGEGWLNFILKAGAYSALFGVLMFSLGINKYEKGLFMGLVSKVLRKK